jgi:dolichol-phosphate mannosyltransferase
MDCDLQDPPEEIPRLLAKAKEGYDLVLTKRKNKKLSPFRRFAGILYFKMLSLFNQEHLNGEFGSFSILHRKVVEAFLRVRDRDRHYLFVLRWLGFKSATLEYEHGERYSGESSYSLKALITLAFDGVFFQTTFLLHWIIYLGFLVSICGWISAFYFIYLYFFRSVPPGWTSLAVLTLIIGGFILISTGITGLYIGKIFEQVKNRPLYVFDQSGKGKTNE